MHKCKSNSPLKFNIMLELNDNDILQRKGISITQIEEQLTSFAVGFPFLEIRSAAEPGKGILQISDEDLKSLLVLWDEYLKTNASVLKFVPASGAASRMFKDLFEFLDSNRNIPEKPAEIKFFDDIKKFAFYDLLDKTCKINSGKNIEELISHGNFKTVVENLLLDKGLNYGNLPKGLLLFHSYPAGNRTPFEEHLAEGAIYAANALHEVQIHYTVSKEHKELFEKKHIETAGFYKKEFNVNYAISFSEQKPSTDTIAADAENQPFRENGELVFRPGGHGALIENLNDLDADVIFIKNIDNVVPDSRKNPTIIYKKVIAGLLIKLQSKCFDYLKLLENKEIEQEMLFDIAEFCERELNNYNTKNLNKENLRNYLIEKLDRPIRVCGMVKNTGEPGGGPFLTVNQDGTVSPQILESSQINLNNPVEKAKMMQSSHFNPVDLVCGVKNYKGEKFNLLKYVDKNTGFISIKSKNGKELKALELPGLWNGAMSDWNTVFVEVPIETFNPVKTVNDLLRMEHQ